MFKIEKLEDGARVLVSDEKIETLHFTTNSNGKPINYGLVITDEILAALSDQLYKNYWFELGRKTGREEVQNEIKESLGLR